MIANAVVKAVPYPRDIARILADQVGRKFLVDGSDDCVIIAGAAGGILAFAPTDNASIGLDPDNAGIELLDLAEVALVLALGRNRD